MNSRKIRKIRQKLGLTQEQFADRLGVSFATLNRWENRHTTPSQMALTLLEAEERKAGLKK